jgi:hypothetical protein
MRDHIAATLSNAARRILKAFGREKVAKIVSRSTAVIYKWSDPSLHYYPNLHHALELDAEFVNRGLGAPPFLTAYTNLLGQKVLENPQVRAELLPEAIKVMNHARKIADEIGIYLASGAAGTETDSLKWQAICKDLRALDELQMASAWGLKHGARQTRDKQ